MSVKWLVVSAKWTSGRSAAFEIGSKDAGPGVGENAERVDAEKDGEGGEAEEEFSFVFHLRAEGYRLALRRSMERNTRYQPPRL